jgi:methylmalonyl-CoA/ethylmalonyl-CoA epimerase
VVGGVDHVGVLTDDLDAVVALAGQLGLTVSAPEAHPELGIEVVWVDLGAVRLEVFRPTDPDGRAARALAADGPGLHHVALTVGDVGASLTRLQGEGVATADDVPRRGVHGGRIAFLDAGGAGGLRIELVEHPAPATD